MNSVEHMDWNPIPRVSPTVAAGFDSEHGTPDETYTDEMLRQLTATNPEFVRELETVANRELALFGFDAKVHFFEGAMAAAGLLISQGDTDIIRQMYEATSAAKDSTAETETIASGQPNTANSTDDDQPSAGILRQFMQRHQERRAFRQVHRGIAAAFILSRFSRQS